jgi:flagellar assembly protein FliH
MRSLSSAVKRGRLLLDPYPIGGKPERLISQQELDEILERKTSEAFEQGFEQGSAKGYEVGEREGSQRAAEEAAARFKREFADKCAAVDALVGEIGGGRERLIQSAEQEAVALALTIACQVLARQVEESSVSPDLVEEAVRQTMARKRVVVRLNPADREALTRDGQALETLFESAAAVEFVDDATVGRCGCVVESNMGIIDAQLDKQIEQLRRALIG